MHGEFLTPAFSFAEALLVEEGSLEQEPGSGIRGVVNGRLVAVGTLDWLRRQGASAPPPDNSAAAAAESSGADSPRSWKTAQSRLEACSGHTRVFVSIGNSIAAYIDMADELRPGAAETVAALRGMGITSILLSGTEGPKKRSLPLEHHRFVV